MAPGPLLRPRDEGLPVGIKELLSVVLGVRVARNVDELREAKRQQRAILDQLAYMESPDGKAAAKSQAQREVAASRLDVAMTWGRVEPADRLRPDLRALEADGGQHAGAAVDVTEISFDWEVGRLYEAALATGGYRRYAEANPDETKRLSQAEFDQYVIWLAELRSRHGTFVDDLFSLYATQVVHGYHMFSTRQRYGFEPAEDDYFARILSS